MRVTMIALLTAGGLAFAVPALAQDVYVGAGPRGVGIGVDAGPRHYRDRDVVVRERRVYRGDDYARGRCTTTIIKRDGMTKKIRRCS